MNKPTDSVRITLFDENNPKYFLVLSEADDPQNLKLPGGRFESDGETAEHVAERELMEELGFKAGQTNLKKVGELVNDDGHSKRYIYSGKIVVEMLKPSKEIDHIEWLTAQTVPEGKNHNHILAAVALGKDK